MINNFMIKGIDISKYQSMEKPIQRQLVKQAGYKFVIIRAGYGNSIKQQDPYFLDHINGTLNAGLHIGAYWFSYACDVTQAITEADIFSTIMKPYKGKIEFPLCLDWEDASEGYFKRITKKDPSTEIVSKMAEAFLKKIESESWFAINYHNKSFYKKYCDVPIMKKFDTWIADYNEGRSQECGIRQITDKCQVSGNVVTVTQTKRIGITPQLSGKCI